MSKMESDDSSDYFSAIDEEGDLSENQESVVNEEVPENERENGNEGVLLAAMLDARREDFQNEFVRGQYDALLGTLQQNGPLIVDIPSRELFLYILENVDEFCDALVHANHVDSLTCGGADIDDSAGERENCIVWPKLELTDDTTSQAWDKLCRAFQTACSKNPLGKLILGGYTLSGECMARLFSALRHTGQDIQLIAIVLPWNTISGQDYRSFVEGLSYLQQCNLHIDLCGRSPPGITREEYIANEPANHFQPGGIITQLTSLEGNSISLHEVSLNSQECESLAGLCTLECLSLTGIYLPVNGYRIVEALQTNKSITLLCLGNGIQDEKFHEALLTTISVNTCIKTLFISDFTSPERVLNVLHHVACTNQTITHFRDMTSRPNSAIAALSQDEKQQLLEKVLKQNYSLEMIEYNGPSTTTLFWHYTHLNKCGRKYLQDDAASRSKCIAVLAKAKNNLDCLYFHLRENPILCTSYVPPSSLEENAQKDDTPTSNLKRKADDCSS